MEGICFSKIKAEKLLLFLKSGKIPCFFKIFPFLPQRLTQSLCALQCTHQEFWEKLFIFFFFFFSRSTVLHDRWSQLLWVFHGLLFNHKSFEKCGGGASPFSEVMGNGDRLNHRLCPVSKNVKMSNMKKTYFHIG